jgi:hypothetical protein
MDPAYLGPDEQLLELISKALNAPYSLETFGDFDAQEARRDRLVAVNRFDQLSEADQEWLLARCREVEAGRSPTLLDPADWGSDWAAEDEALDADDEVKALEPDEDGWVGV